MCRAFEIIFSLLGQIDAGDDGILFFADEGGSSALGIDWEKVLPAWFGILSVTADPGEYAQRVDAILKKHYEYGRGKMLSVARRIATPAQRQVLPKS